MEIRKLELNLGQKIANPFKTTRKSSTNPFKYQDFEGNTIDPLICADVLVSFKGKENKLKMISSSVIGSMVKLRNSITEPIVNFVRRVKEGITASWTYAKNTNIELPGLKNISQGIHNTTENIHNILNYDVGKGLTDSISGLGKNISEDLAFLNKDITEIGHDLATKWNALISSIKVGQTGTTKISSDMTVAELKDLWIKENELAAKTVSIKPVSNMEVKVA